MIHIPGTRLRELLPATESPSSNAVAVSWCMEPGAGGPGGGGPPVAPVVSHSRVTVAEAPDFNGNAR